METSPDFRVGSLRSLLVELRRFYCELGYVVELAFVRTEGVCGCGDPECRSVPHFVPEAADSSKSVHLVMRGDNALGTRNTKVLYRASGDGSIVVPMLRHGETGHVFVSDPESFPALFPVLGSEREAWISLPPHRSDDSDGVCTLPAWVSPLSVPVSALSKVIEVIGSEAFSRLKKVRDFGEEIVDLSGDGVLSGEEIVNGAMDILITDGAADEALGLLSISAVAGLITLKRAERLLEENRQRVGDDVLSTEHLYAAVFDLLFGEEKINTGEIVSLLFEAARSLADPDEDDDTEDDDIPNGDEGETELEDSLDFDEDEHAPSAELADPCIASDLSQVGVSWLEAPTIDLMDLPDGGRVSSFEIRDETSNDTTGPCEIDWAQELKSCGPDITLASLVEMFRGVGELGLTDEALDTLAALDMVLTAMPSVPENPVALLEYLWPNAEHFHADLEFHHIVTQIFAGLLLRFEMAREAGMLPKEPTLVAQIAAGAGVQAISELIGDPGVVFWLERHVFNVQTSELTGMRFRTVERVLETAGDDIITDISTGRFLSLLGEGVDD